MSKSKQSLQMLDDAVASMRLNRRQHFNLVNAAQMVAADLERLEQLEVQAKQNNKDGNNPE